MLILSFIFFVIALLYSMVGFGGGSSYNALLVLYGLNYLIYPSVALLCNLIVVTGGCILFYQRGHFSSRLLYPFIVTSIPMAYLMGSLVISKTLFLYIICIALFLSGIVMIYQHKLQTKIISPQHNPNLWRWGLPIGAGLGSLAGLVGIGGGIFLSPVLYLLGWGTAKQIAATASGFILVNSLAGLGGHFFKLQEASIRLEQILAFWPLFVAVLIGGQIGSRLSSSRLPPRTIQLLTAILVLYVSLKIGWDLISKYQ